VKDTDMAEAATGSTGATPTAGTSRAGNGNGEKVPLKLWLGLVALALSAVMHGIDAMVVTVATPTISHELDTGLAQLLWVTTGYLLAYAATLVAAGKLGDRHGHRKVFLVGVVGFAVSSVLVGSSQTIEMLIAFRVLQGVCGASLVPSALAILRLTFPPDRIKIAVGVFMGSFALSAAAGPFLGGVLVEFAGWRWVFFINVFAAAVTFAVVLVLIKPTRPVDTQRSLDLPGIALLAVALAALVLAINQTSTAGWAGAVPITCFVVAVVFGTLFVLRERSAAEPLLPLDMFRSRTLVTGCVLILFASGLTFALWFYLSLFLQNVQGAGALRTGLELLPIPAAGIVAAPLGGALNQKFGARIPLTLGIVFGMVAFFGLSRVTTATAYGSVWPFLVALGLCMSFTVPIGTEAVVSAAEDRLAGVASGVAETMGSLGPALGVASVGTAIAMVVEGGIAGRLAGAGVAPAAADHVATGGQAIAQGSVPAPPGTSPELLATITRVAHEAYTSGLRTVLLVCAIVLAVFLPIVWLIKPSATAGETEENNVEEAAR
jgi:EmrB/QacA subfamily drug resistance transporter